MNPNKPILLVKPMDYKKFVDVIKTIHMYWKLNELPE